MRITSSDLRKLEPPEKGYRLHRDDSLTGFAVKHFASGTFVFCVNYSVNGRERRMTIGKAPTWTPQAARVEAQKLLRQIDRGTDPLAEKQAAKRSEPTVADLIREYSSIRAAQLRSGPAIVRRLERDILPELGDVKLSALTKRDIILTIERKARTAPHLAARVLADLKAALTWAVRRDWITHSPATLVDPPTVTNARERVLSYAEIKTLWESAPDAPVWHALKLSLLTACRPGEVCAMEWEEIREGWWTLPASKTKAKRAHRVPLTEMALELIGERPEDRSHVFPARSKRRYLVEDMLAAAVRNVEYLGLEPWQPRDLRRTAATHMAELGVAPFIIDRVLNHADPSVRAKHYAHYSYDAEKRAVLETWERKLRAVLTGETSDVLEFRR